MESPKTSTVAPSFTSRASKICNPFNAHRAAALGAVVEREVSCKPSPLTGRADHAARDRTGNKSGATAARKETSPARSAGGFGLLSIQSYPSIQWELQER